MGSNDFISSFRILGHGQSPEDLGHLVRVVGQKYPDLGPWTKNVYTKDFLLEKFTTVHAWASSIPGQSTGLDRG